MLRNLQYREIIRSNEAGAFSEEDMESQAMYQEVIDLEETLSDYIQAQAQARWNDASAPEEDLFHYLMHYTFAREVDEQLRGGDERAREHHLVLPDGVALRKPSPHQRGIRPVSPVRICQGVSGQLVTHSSLYI